MTRPAALRATFFAITLSALAAHTAARAECFSMYDAKNALVYQSGTSPIDLSHSISEEMARRFPARSLVISTTLSCPDEIPGTGATNRYLSSGDAAGGNNAGGDTQPRAYTRSAPRR